MGLEPDLGRVRQGGHDVASQALTLLAAFLDDVRDRVRSDDDIAARQRGGDAERAILGDDAAGLGDAAGAVGEAAAMGETAVLAARAEDAALAAEAAGSAAAERVAAKLTGARVTAAETAAEAMETAKRQR